MRLINVEILNEINGKRNNDNVAMRLTSKYNRRAALCSPLGLDTGLAGLGWAGLGWVGWAGLGRCTTDLR